MQNVEKIAIVTADDALMNSEIDAAILHLLRQYFCPLTSISFVVDGLNAQMIPEYIAATREGVDYGLHLALPQGNFDQKRGMLPLLLANPKTVLAEIDRQIEKFQDELGDLGHITSHFGAHLIPTVLPLVLKRSRQLNIPVRSLSGVTSDLRFSKRRHLGTTVDSIIQALNEIKPNKPRELIFHPALALGDKEEIRIKNGYDEFIALSDPSLQAFFEKNPHIKRVSWRDIK